MSSAVILVSVALASSLLGCSGRDSSADGEAIVRLTGSDTMVNLDQAWAENYKAVNPKVSVQIAGGGSGVGIAGLIDGILDVAASSREMEPEEVERATKTAGSPPQEFIVGMDALAVFVHDSSPLMKISIEELAEVYGEGGRVTTWSQLGVRNPSCPSDKIIRVSRQNNSGTYAYFRESVLGPRRELKLGSIDSSGSKDVVALVSRTPCSIGYSGMAYATPGARALAVSRKKGDPAKAPTIETALDGSYPIARPLYFYSRGTPAAHVKEFIDWTLSEQGQMILQEIGYVPAPKASK